MKNNKHITFNIDHESEEIINSFFSNKKRSHCTNITTIEELLFSLGFQNNDTLIISLEKRHQYYELSTFNIHSETYDNDSQLELDSDLSTIKLNSNNRHICITSFDKNKYDIDFYTSKDTNQNKVTITIYYNGRDKHAAPSFNIKFTKDSKVLDIEFDSSSFTESASAIDILSIINSIKWDINEIPLTNDEINAFIYANDLSKFTIKRTISLDFKRQTNNIPFQKTKTFKNRRQKH